MPEETTTKLIGCLLDVSASMKTALETGQGDEHAIDRLRAVIRATIKVAQTEKRNDPDSQIFVGAFGLNVDMHKGCPPVIDLCGAIDALLGNHEDRRSGRELLIDLAKSKDLGYVTRYIKTRLTDDQARIVFAHLQLHKEKIDEFVAAIPSVVTTTVINYVAGDFVDGLVADNSKAMKMAKRIAKEWLNDFRDFQPRKVSEVILLLQRLEERTASVKDSEGGEGKVKGGYRGQEDDRTLLDTLRDYLYGLTPMQHALETSLKTFRKHEIAGDKILIMVSDGLFTGKDPLPISQKLADENVTLATIYLTDDSSVPRKILHDAPNDDWHGGQRALFDMTSRIRGSAHPVPVLASTDWSIPSSGECALFATVCSPLALDDFCSLLLSARFRSADVLLDLLGRVKTDEIVNDEYVKVRKDPSNQEGRGICYAHATAAVAHMALLRIVGREGGVPKIEDIREKILIEFPEHKDGQPTVDVLEAVTGWYWPLKFNEVDEDGARQAVLRRRPVLTTFCLSDPGWTTFGDFFEDQATMESTLTTTEMLPYRELPPDGGHAVVMTDCAPRSLTFLNSWGYDWGDNGSFSVEDVSVLELSGRDATPVRFYDVFWYEEDLKPEERKAYRKRADEAAEKLYDRYPGMKEQEAMCPHCKATSTIDELGELTSTIREAVCPSCKEGFMLEPDHALQGLYARQGLEEAT